jgi:PilZ domain
MATTTKAHNDTAWKELSEEAHSDRRRERRINLGFPIELFGFDSANHYFTERSVTINVSKSGCQFRLNTRVNEKTVVAIRVTLPERAKTVPQRPALFLISWVRRAGEKWSVGAASLQTESIWPIAMPDDPTSPQAA